MKKELYIAPKYSIVILLFLFGLKGFSQTDKVYFIPDSLKEKTYKELFERHNFYYTYNGKKDTVKAQFYAKMYLHKGKNEKDTVRIANGYSQILSSINSSNLRIRYSDSILVITKDINHYVYPGYGYMVKGMTYHDLGFYKESLKNYLIAEKYANNNNNKQHLFYIKEGIAHLRRILGNHKEAISIYKTIIEESKKHTDAYLVLLYSLSGCYIDINELDSALVFNKIGRKESLVKRDTYRYYNFVKQTGYIASLKGNYKNALDSINKGALQDWVPSDFFNTYYHKGNIFYKIKKEEKAFYYFKKADSIFDANPDDVYPYIRATQEYLLKYYGKKKDFENQLKYIDRLLRVDSILDSYRENINKNIDREYDRPRLLAEKQTIIDSLEKDNKQSNYAIWGLIGLSILILTLTIRFYYLQHQYKIRFNRLIKDTTKENTLEKTEEKEALDGISEHIITSVLNQLKTFEDEAQFLDKTITLANLSKRFNTNSSYLSKIVNHYNNKNFNSYLTELRINHCIEQLQTNKTLRTYTIKAIAEEVGFKNSESFSKAFFKTTGIYPSYFVKQIEKQEKII